MITQNEYAERKKTLSRLVENSGLDAFLVTSRDSIYYLTGLTYEPLERPFFMIVLANDSSKVLVPRMEQVHLQTLPEIGDVYAYWEYPSPAGDGWTEKLHELLSGIKKLGVEPSLTQEIASQLSEFDPTIAPLVEKMRLVKSENEILMLRQAASFAVKGMDALLSASYYGVSEIELFSQSRSIQLDAIKTTEFDALNSNFLTVTWPAKLADQPHGVPDIADQLKSGPHIALSFMRVNGYSAELERTYFVEAPTKEMREMYSTMLEARRRAQALVKPGVPCAEVDLAANGFLRENGLGKYLMHRTGHGIGLGNHEAPYLADGSDEVLAENMLISIEPGIYIPKFGAFRHSDTYLVTKDGYENLTPYKDDIESLTIFSKKPLTQLRGAITRKVAGVR